MSGPDHDIFLYSVELLTWPVGGLRKTPRFDASVAASMSRM
jgi:hypothetical protein